MKTEICVPAAALADAGESGEGVAPAVGDSVDFTGRGTVTRAEGGNLYVQLAEVNGQPVGGDMAGEPDSDDAMDKEMEGYQRGGMGGGGMVAMLAVLAWLFMGLGDAQAQAELSQARQRTSSGGAVSNYVAVTVPSQVFSVEVNNFSGATLYLMVFDSATNQLANATPHFTALPVPTGTVCYKDWSAAGAPFNYGVNVCLSTTPFSLTNATSGGTATVIHSIKQ